jgi:hypothetical protein
LACAFWQDTMMSLIQLVEAVDRRVKKMDAKQDGLADLLEQNLAQLQRGQSRRKSVIGAYNVSERDDQLRDDRRGSRAGRSD